MLIAVLASVAARCGGDLWSALDERSLPYLGDRQFESSTRSETHLIGVVGGVVGGFGGTHHGIKWEGNSLVFESGSYTGQRAETGVWTERREIWSLDPDGRLHVVITTSSSADESRTVTLVYRRP